MPRTPARCTEADMNRAAKVAKKNGMEVHVLPDGTIKITPVDSGDEVQKAIAKEREFTLG